MQREVGGSPGKTRGDGGRTGGNPQAWRFLIGWLCQGVGEGQCWGAGGGDELGKEGCFSTRAWVLLSEL